MTSERVAHYTLRQFRSGDKTVLKYIWKKKKKKFFFTMSVACQSATDLKDIEYC